MRVGTSAKSVVDIAKVAMEDEEDEGAIASVGVEGMVSSMM